LPDDVPKTPFKPKIVEGKLHIMHSMQKGGKESIEETEQRYVSTMYKINKTQIQSN
jgi:hypothetical protein